MIITIIASGSRGDVQPSIALGKGLLDAGYQVRFVSHENFRELITAQNLDFYPVAGNVQDIAQSSKMRELLDKGNFLTILAEMSRSAREGAVHLARAGLSASEGADLLLAGLGGIFTAAALAEKFNLPVIQAHYIPFTTTKDYPSFALPANLPGVGRLLNPASYFVTQQMIWQGFRAADQIARAKVLQIPSSPFLGPWNSPQLKGMPVLYGYSPAVIPPAADWPANIHVTGYWFLDEDQDWQPPARLVEFLESGPAPVFIGFGSMSSRDPQATAQLILDAVALAGLRAIILSGWGGMERADLLDSVISIDSIPYRWLFPRVAAVVHHGGAGTTSEGLRAGVPSIIIPFFGDQPFWGRQIQRLGVGPKPISRRRLTAANLSRALKTAVTDNDIRHRASGLGELIRAEDGVGSAVAIIKKYLHPKR